MQVGMGFLGLNHDGTGMNQAPFDVVSQFVGDGTGLIGWRWIDGELGAGGGALRAEVCAGSHQQAVRKRTAPADSRISFECTTRRFGYSALETSVFTGTT